ncbi:MAG: hypothetical protein AB1489_39795 [Acidobacteriota bacterium]
MKITPLPLLSIFVLLSLLTISCSFSTANIGSAVMAKDVKSDTKEPVNVTNTYDASDKILHCVVKLANAPDSTKVRARWIAVKAEGVEPNFKITESDITAGSGNVDFTLTPGASGFPAGDYKVEIYLDPDTERGKNPAKEVPFSIKGSAVPPPSETTTPTETPTN